MKNIVFYGPYRQTDGWGEASYRYLECLTYTNHNIKAIFTQLGKNVEDKYIHENIIKAEENTITDPDIVIFYSLPQLLNTEGLKDWTAKKILFFHFETQTLTPDIVEKISNFDLIIVSTIVEKYILYSYNIEKVVAIPCPINFKEYNVKYNIPEGEYKFYTIGEFVERKNIISLIHSFISTFSSNDNVSLTIKSNISKSQFADILLNISSIARKAKNIQNYPRIEYIDKRLSREEMIRLHYEHDCFVSISHGESICLPLLDALAIGNRAIVTSQTGMDDHVGDSNISLVKGSIAPCYVKNPPLTNIYSCNDFWINPDLHDFMIKMRINANAAREKQIGKMMTEQHSKKRISKQLSEVLDEL